MADAEPAPETKPMALQHPIVVMGAGMGGMSTALDLLRRGRKDFVIIERCDGFGGTTWREVANKTTKLQTEKGTYGPDYMDFLTPVDPNQKTWPRRDDILAWFEEAAERHGLHEYAKLSTCILKVEPKGDTLKDGHYALKIQDTTKEGDVIEDFKAGACVLAPGVFYLPKDLKLPGKEKFGGYITHGSYNSLKPQKLKGEKVVLIGHGGFVIENVRTSIEHKCVDIKILCRRRHLTGPKCVSWLVSRSHIPIPGHMFVEIMNVMYNLVGFDVWTHHGIQTNESRSHAVISQATSFGVNDVYFLTQAFGVCEVIEDEVDKLSPKCIHTKKGRDIECGVILKCLGSTGDPDFDDSIGLKKLVGFWVNGDPLCTTLTCAYGVQARNYAGFSLGPGYAGQIKANHWFIEYPQTWDMVKDSLPVQVRKEGESCAYKLPGGHVLGTMTIVGTIPWLGAQLGEMDKLKAGKTRAAHPQDEFLAECEGEWKMYTQMMRDNGQIPKDAEDIPYPYSHEKVNELNELIEKAFIADQEKKMGKKK
mmetsp:Transcript_131393/g.293975  ORF Transcript_131393/g.293975 Transcript_131393/m.293975 type:complete len:534 (+) Transcript_131393:81-1682(+)